MSFCLIVKHSLNIISIQFRLKSHPDDFQLYFNHVRPIAVPLTLCGRWAHCTRTHVFTHFLWRRSPTLTSLIKCSNAKGKFVLLQTFIAMQARISYYQTPLLSERQLYLFPGAAETNYQNWYAILLSILKNTSPKSALPQPRSLRLFFSTDFRKISSLPLNSFEEPQTCPDVCPEQFNLGPHLPFVWPTVYLVWISFLLVGHVGYTYVISDDLRILRTFFQIR